MHALEVGLTGQSDERSAIQERVGDRRDQVRRARAEGPQADAGPAGQTAVGVGHVRAALLVADGDELDRRIGQRLVQVERFLARDPEHVPERPSASRHSTNTSEALRSLISAPYITKPGQLRPRRPRLVRAACCSRSRLRAAAGVGAAGDVLYISGGGYGHGIGMSQYGAYGYALHGKDYRCILAHYYTGTSIGTTNPNQIVRVLLATGSAAFAGATRGRHKKLNPSTTYVVKPLADGSLKLVNQRRQEGQGTFSAPLTVTGPGAAEPRRASAAIAARSSSGPTARAACRRSTRSALDDYVRGRDRRPRCRRAGRRRRSRRRRSRRARTRSPPTSAAAATTSIPTPARRCMAASAPRRRRPTPPSPATSGQIVTYDGAPVVTYFFASSGGYTENVENVWPGATPEPWLRGVPDPYDGAGGDPYHHWTLRDERRRGDAQARLAGQGQAARDQGHQARCLAADHRRRRWSAPAGARHVTGTELEEIFGLLDTWASFTTISSSAAHGQVSGNVSTTSGSAAVALQYCGRAARGGRSAAATGSAGAVAVRTGTCPARRALPDRVRDSCTDPAAGARSCSPAPAPGVRRRC